MPFTLDEAEKFQEKIERKIEFVDGQIVPKEGSTPLSEEVILYVLSDKFDLVEFQTLNLMPKTSYKHSQLVTELTVLLWDNINRSEYRVYAETLSISKKRFGYFYVPDLMVSLVRQEVYDEYRNLENPHTIIEVLSDSTEKKDRNEKKNAYQNIPSLQEYILVAQKSHKIEQYLRKGKTEWVVKIYDDLNQTCVMTVGVKIHLKDLYQNIDIQ